MRAPVSYDFLKGLLRMMQFSLSRSFALLGYGICIYDHGERHVLQDVGHELVLREYRVYRGNNETHWVTSMTAARCQISEVFVLLHLLLKGGGQFGWGIDDRRYTGARTLAYVHVHTWTSGQTWGWGVTHRLRVTGRNCMHTSAMQPHAIVH